MVDRVGMVSQVGKLGMVAGAIGWPGRNGLTANMVGMVAGAAGWPIR